MWVTLQVSVLHSHITKRNSIIEMKKTIVLVIIEEIAEVYMVARSLK